MKVQLPATLELTFVPTLSRVDVAFLITAALATDHPP